jgi:hypothetical protein
MSLRGVHQTKQSQDRSPRFARDDSVLYNEKLLKMKISSRAVFDIWEGLPRLFCHTSFRSMFQPKPDRRYEQTAIRMHHGWVGSCAGNSWYVQREGEHTCRMMPMLLWQWFGDVVSETLVFRHVSIQGYKDKPHNNSEKGSHTVPSVLVFL